MVDIKDRVALPEQCVALKKAGLQQQSQYAWFLNEKKEWAICFDDSDLFNKVVDWKDDEGYYAAPDLTDLGIYLKSLGFFISGPVYQLEGLQQDPNMLWWADEITSVTDFSLDTYKAYGCTEVSAKAELLVKLIAEGRPPVDWKYYIVDKLSGITNLVNKHSYGGPKK